MHRNIIETIVAGLVLVVGLGFLAYVLNATEHRDTAGYPLQARFQDAPSLKPGAEVRIAGVAVGRVSAVTLDMQRFDVLVDFQLSMQVKLPADSEASLSFDGALGDAILVLRPGQDATILQAGERVRNTVSPVNVVDQLGRFMYAGEDDDF
jgi:phospholipid/cholesterol/gamma-HCH transport system substrate-binding protein